MIFEWATEVQCPVPLFMSIHTLPPGGFTAERIQEIAALGQNDPLVRGYRSFHSLAEGRIVWLLTAPDRRTVEEWCRKVGLPLDGVTELELEGFVGTVRPVHTSIPNQLTATVTGIARDETLALVSLRLPSGESLVAMVGTDEVDDLGLVPGATCDALFRATNISLAKDIDTMKLTFPNQIKGRVTNIITGSTLVIVHMDTPAGPIVSAVIPSAAESIDLKIGDEVTALFKALDVSLAKG